MPRNASGVYTLPAGNPVAGGTVIASTWANPTMGDIAEELTNSLDRSGRGGMLVPFLNTDGSKAFPGMSFTNEPGMGIYRFGINDMRVAISGRDTTRWINDGGSPVGDQHPFQIWDGATWKNAIYQGGDANILANDTFLQGTDFAGTGVVDIVKVNASDEIEFGAALVAMPTGGLVVGHTAQVNVSGGGISPIQSFATGGNGVQVARYSATVGGAGVYFFHSRQTTIGGANTALISGDRIGDLIFYGDDGVDNNTQSALIRVTTEGTIGAGRIPTKMEFSTGTDAASTVVTLGLAIDSTQSVTIPNGFLGIGTSTPVRPLHIVGTALTTLPTLGGVDQAVFENDGNSNIALVGGAGSGNEVKFYDPDGLGGAITYGHSDDSMRFSTGSIVEAMRIDSTQNVSILDGNLSVDVIEQSAISQVITVRNSAVRVAPDQGASIIFHPNSNYAGSAVGASISAVETSGTTSNLVDLFFVTGVGGVPVEGLRITSAQDVSIPNGDLFISGANQGLVIGHTAAVGVVGLNTEAQVIGTGANDSSLSLGRWQAGNTGAPTFIFYKSRAAVGANAAVLPGDQLGTISFGGDDGVDNNTQSARIRIFVEGTVGAGRVPSTMQFYTGTNATSTVVTLGLEIDSAQDVTIPNGNLAVSAYSATGATSGLEITTGALIRASRTGTGANTMTQYVNANGIVGSISTSGSATAYNTSSDPRLKSKFREIKPETAYALIEQAHDEQMIGEFDWLKGGQTTWGYNAHKLIDQSDQLGGSEGEGPRDKPLGGVITPAGVDQSKRVPLLEAALYGALQRLKELESPVETLPT